MDVQESGNISNSRNITDIQSNNSNQEFSNSNGEQILSPQTNNHVSEIIDDSFFDMIGDLTPANIFIAFIFTSIPYFVPYMSSFTSHYIRNYIGDNEPVQSTELTSRITEATNYLFFNLISIVGICMIQYGIYISYQRYFSNNTPIGEDNNSLNQENSEHSNLEPQEIGLTGVE